MQLANQSGKTVTFIGIELTFFRGDDQAPGLPVSWPFKYGLDPFDSDNAAVPHPQFRSIQPGEKIDIILSDQEYEEIKKGLRETHFPTSIKKVEMRVLKIGFDDGTAWNTGRTYKRDPTNIKGPLKGWTPMEGGGEKPEARKSAGSITKDFLTRRRRSHISASDQRIPPDDIQ